MKSIILLSGPVGAGKSTVACELIKLLPAPVSYIEGDTFWKFIPQQTPDKNPVKNFGLIMASMVLAAIPFARTGNQVLVDFSTPPWFLDTAQRLVKRKNIPLDYVVLRPDLATCAVRASTRKEGTISNYKRYEELYHSFDEAERYMIDDEVSSPTELASIICDGLKAGMFRVK